MTLVERYRRARADEALVVLEGFHALKHALRFGAEVLEVALAPGAALEPLVRKLAPDLAPRLGTLPVRAVDAALFAQLAPRSHRTGVLALARRPRVTAEDVLAAPGRVVVLDHPRHAENVGAAVRVAAAAGAAGVLTLGPLDPWGAAAVRSAAGLHYALRVARADVLPATARPLVALAPEGILLVPGALPAEACLVFGAEREGLSAATSARAVLRVRIPMRPGVSSLNLATAVAVALYADAGT